MTLQEIEDALPNGFHDTRINNINIDYVNRVVTFDLEVWSAESKDSSSETYRAAQLTLSRLLFLIIEPPDSHYPYLEQNALWVDSGSVDSGSASLPSPLLESLPEGAFTHWFFVREWNAFMYVAAMEANINMS